jgi:uncharacterized protein DUF6755
MIIRNPLRPGFSADQAIRNSQHAPALLLVMAFVIVFLNIQLWVLVQAVEGILRGEDAIVLPATLISGLCFLGAWRLWRMVQG